MSITLLEKVLLGVVVFTTFLSACKQEEPGTVNSLDDELITQLDNNAANDGIAEYILPNSDDFAAIPQDPRNPLNAAKVKLGQLLFHETGIAINPNKPESEGQYSCASCHHAPGGFQACLPQGISEGGTGYGVTGEGRTLAVGYEVEDADLQPLRTPSVMHAAFQTNQLWNGQFGGTHLNEGTQSQWTADTPKETNHLGYEGTEIQAIAGLKVHRMGIENSIVTTNPEYVSLFNEAFPELAGNDDLITRETAGLAIAAYERTLMANRAPFQKWLKGDHDAMSESEKIGAILFFGKGQCGSCHTGPALNSMKFYALGMNDLHMGSYGDAFLVDAEAKDHLGRGGFTGKITDMFKFKVPQLYNLKDSPFYGHGSSFRSIKEIVEYKNEAVAENPNVPDFRLANEFQKLYLSDTEIEHIANFIENGLRDPELNRYVPNVLPSGNCFPNNDQDSQFDLGCQ